MAELLLELLSEEIPARMQARAAEDLKRLVTDGLKKEKLTFTAAEAYVTPRRLALVVDGLPEKQPDVVEERKGPRVGAPEKAVNGFLKAAGLDSLDACEVRSDPKKGDYYVAIQRRVGRETSRVLVDVLRTAISKLPWPKSMRWADYDLRWVRPLHGILAVLDGVVIQLAIDRRGSETYWDPDLGTFEDSYTPEYIEKFATLIAGNRTIGHRFAKQDGTFGIRPDPSLPGLTRQSMGPRVKPEGDESGTAGAISVTSFADYKAKLRDAKVMLDPAERREVIRAGAEKAAADAGLSLKPDDGLLHEVAGLVEWPVVLMGRIDEDFMDLPPEVLATSMRAHQKYFSVLDKDGKLAPRFIVVGNIEARDGGKEIIAGNERVLRARLSDAKFFWDQDRKSRLDSKVPKLAERIFHAKLGSDRDRVERLRQLATALSQYVPEAPREPADRAALLCKADLTAEMVGEFPELQGVMGRYYALHDGEPVEIAEAIAEHYSPLGPTDDCPSRPVSVCVALADKIDTLVGFFSIDEKPTGSKDPFALRRAALGVIRLIIENSLRIPLSKIIFESYRAYLMFADRALVLYRADGFENGSQYLISNVQSEFEQRDYDSVWISKSRQITFPGGGALNKDDFVGEFAPHQNVRKAVLDFFADRLKVHLREKGVRHDLVSAVFSLGGEDDLVRLLARVDALASFLGTEDGADLLTAFRRAANIVRIEEKKDGAEYGGDADASLLRQEEETILSRTLGDVMPRVAEEIRAERFHEAMSVLAGLRRPVDAFFDHVTVNCDEPDLRRNRLRLLSTIRSALNEVADFSMIEG